MKELVLPEIVLEAPSTAEARQSYEELAASLRLVGHSVILREPQPTPGVSGSPGALGAHVPAGAAGGVFGTLGPEQVTIFISAGIATTLLNLVVSDAYNAAKHWARRRFAKKRKTEPDGNPRPVLIIIRGPDGRTLRSWEINESGEREGTDHKLQPRPQPDTRIGPGGHRADRRPARTGQLTGHQRVLAGAPPIHAPGRRLRRTLLLEEQLDEAQRSQTQVLLTGPGVHDFLVTRDGASRRLTAFLHGYCQERGIGYVRYTTAEGTRSYPTLPGGQATIIRACDPNMEPTDAVRRVVTDLRDQMTPAMFSFDYADAVLDADRLSPDVSVLCEQLQALTADSGWHQAGLQLVLVDRGGGVTSRLAGHPGIRTIYIGPPDQTELTMFARSAAGTTNAARLFLEPSLSAEETGRRAGGLLNLHLHEMRLASSPDSPVTAERIAAIKAAVIRDGSGGTLELMPSRASFGADVAGLPAVRLALADAQRAGRTTLKILLSGPPGTGKTLAATAIAETLNVPAVRYGEILNEYVGVAERNMTRANQLLRAMAPLVLFIDEADQVGLGARGTRERSSEVHQHLRAALFEFLGDTGEQNGITVVATTNVPDRLDDTALSRFNVLPVLFASAVELSQIMGIHAQRLGITLDGDLTDILVRYTTAGGVLSGRSAVHLLEAAHVQALRAGHQMVTPQHVQAALDGWVGNDWTPVAEYSTLTSLIAARHIDTWPWVAAAQLGETHEFPSYLRTYLTNGGQVDVARMRKRIAELGRNQIADHG